MTTQRYGRRPAGRKGRASLLVVALAAAACGTSTGSPAPASPAPGSPAPATALPPVTDEPAVDGPPAALAAVDGGDPIAGQLGTYIWGETGSDSPWLRGAPITVGIGETFTIRLEPAVGIASWSARYVPSTSDDTAGAVSLGEGVGAPALDVPPAGDWTVELAVTFADGQGEARYAWAVRVE